MHVAAFLTLYNELQKGNLIRCLEGCRLWADSIWIYDDGSDDGSQSVYGRYTPAERCILSEQNDWVRETWHKAELLDLIHQSDVKPDWVIWIDGDTVWESRATEGGALRAFLEGVLPDHRLCCGRPGHINLWGSSAVERTDNKWASVRPKCVWRYRPDLTFRRDTKLHGNLFPHNVGPEFSVPFRLVHFGYASPEAIARKIEEYRHHNRGWNWERIVREDWVTLRNVDPSVIPDYAREADPARG